MRPPRVFGADWCEDTQRTRAHLDQLRVPYEYINIDRNPEARDWVKQVNGGKQRTPTVEIDQELLVEPDDAALDRILREKDLLH